MIDATMTASESTAVEMGTEIEPQPTHPEVGLRRTGEFDACVEDIRRRLGSNTVFPFARVEDRVRRRLGVEPMSAGAAALAGLTGFTIRLAVALSATAVVGTWTGIPWGRWAVVLVGYSLLDAVQTLVMGTIDAPPKPRQKRFVEDWTALLPTIVRESDLRELADFTRRCVRLPVAAGVGVLVTAAMLGACWLFTPTAVSELPVGSSVLLALVLFNFGSGVINPFDWGFMARESRYDHHLFWPSPADSPEVQRALGMTTFFGFASGMWITVYLVLAVILVSWDSAVVLPLAVGFIAIGYVYSIGLAFRDRAAIEKIIQRVRTQRLQGLRHRIDAFGPRYTDLSLEESQQLRDLLALHNMIRDAPTSPTTTHTLLHTLVGLILPTIAFVVTVFGEVYAERALDAILP